MIVLVYRSIGVVTFRNHVKVDVCPVIGDRLRFQDIPEDRLGPKVIDREILGRAARGASIEGWVSPGATLWTEDECPYTEHRYLADGSRNPREVMHEQAEQARVLDAGWTRVAT